LPGRGDFVFAADFQDISPENMTFIVICWPSSNDKGCCKGPVDVIYCVIRAASSVETGKETNWKGDP
jgi:hypothetical protein